MAQINRPTDIVSLETGLFSEDYVHWWLWSRGNFSDVTLPCGDDHWPVLSRGELVASWRSVTGDTAFKTTHLYKYQEVTMTAYHLYVTIYWVGLAMFDNWCMSDSSDIWCTISLQGWEDVDSDRMAKKASVEYQAIYRYFALVQIKT